MVYSIAFAALVVGFAAAWLISNRKFALQSDKLLNQIGELNNNLTQAELQKALALDRLQLKTANYEKLELELAQNLNSSTSFALEAGALRVENRNLLEKLQNQKIEIDQMQKRLVAEFENIANKILKNRADEFSISNHKSMAEILNPLKEKIVSFEKKVDDNYDKDLRDRISLREEVRKLSLLNAQVSEEANNLTKALKGDVKKQGNWGEVVLERVLERSGLSKGQEYEREQVVEGGDHSVQRPDVIIRLPENKHIIIDSKVSLVAYERFMSADSEEMQIAHLKEHILSLRSHIKLLSDKNYQNAFNINTPDFVLMFLPIEASFSVAVQGDNDIFAYAWERNIVIVSPTTLLATLRTIASIWKQENQTKNAQEIARLSGTLYDKFIGFTEDMLKIKSNIDRAANSYDDAFKKMKEGNGNIIRTAEKIKELGAKTGNKSLPTGFDVFK